MSDWHVHSGYGSVRLATMQAEAASQELCLSLMRESRLGCASGESEYQYAN